MRRLLVVTVSVAALALAGCAGYRTERQGRDVGRAVCDVKHASPGDVQQELSKLNNKLDNVGRVTGRPIEQDVQGIRNNVSDLVNHVSSGNSALAHQDVVAIQRNFQQAVDSTSGLTKRYYEGVIEGLGDCT